MSGQPDGLGLPTDEMLVFIPEPEGTPTVWIASTMIMVPAFLVLLVVAFSDRK